MKIEVFEPRDGIRQHEDIGLVVFNHGGSKVSQDTGRDSQHYADWLHMPVVAVDRPGTSTIVPHPLLRHRRRSRTSKRYTAEFARLGKNIDHVLDSLGVATTLVHGRSAGGLGALALVRTETVSSASHFFAAEPVGCENVSIPEANKRVKAYSKLEAELQAQGIPKPDNGYLTPLDTLGRMASIPTTFALDAFHSKPVWATEIAIEYITDIANQQPDVEGVVEFAEHSLVVTPEIYAERLAPLGHIRPGVEVRQTTHTTHASYDDNEFMVSRMRPIINDITWQLARNTTPANAA